MSWKDTVITFTVYQNDFGCRVVVKGDGVPETHADGWHIETAMRNALRSFYAALDGNRDNIKRAFYGANYAELVNRFTRNAPKAVAELIAELQQLPPDMRVMVNGFSGGLCDPDVSPLEHVVINSLPDDHLFGPHSVAKEGGEKVVLIGRNDIDQMIKQKVHFIGDEP